MPFLGTRFGQNHKFWTKLLVLDKSARFGQSHSFWTKLLVLDKTARFGQNYSFWKITEYFKQFKTIRTDLLFLFMLALETRSKTSNKICKNRFIRSDYLKYYVTMWLWWGSLEVFCFVCLFFEIIWLCREYVLIKIKNA